MPTLARPELPAISVVLASLLLSEFAVSSFAVIVEELVSIEVVPFTSVFTVVTPMAVRPALRLSESVLASLGKKIDLFICFQCCII